LPDKAKRGIINEIIVSEEGIAMASEVLINITKDEVEQAWLRSREKYELDTQSNLTYAREKGMQEGKQEGMKEGEQKSKTNIARNALAEGLPVDVIQKITGLDMETIMNIQAGL
jgi:predicted transposase/invertase (TIGR01784 family)